MILNYHLAFTKRVNVNTKALKLNLKCLYGVISFSELYELAFAN